MVNAYDSSFNGNYDVFVRSAGWTTPQTSIGFPEESEGRNEKTIVRARWVTGTEPDGARFVRVQGFNIMLSLVIGEPAN
jgi:hypothetical protein